MGYCYPTWISDYTWNGLADRIRLTSDFSMAASPLLTGPRPRSVQGFQTGGRAPVWGIVDGPLLPVNAAVGATRHARLLHGDGRSEVVAVQVDALLSPRGPEADARVLSFNLPDDRLVGIDVTVDGEHWPVRTDAL
jgi:hypothetical protein